MKLEEMQAALDREARKKAAKLEKDNRHLTVAIRKKQERIDRMESSLRVMYNRCYATMGMSSDGMMCAWCGERTNCHAIRSTGKKGETDNA